MRSTPGSIPKSEREMAIALFRYWLLVVLLTCLLLIDSLPCLRAQVLSGITGIVTDAKGNAIVGGNVTATNTATGVASHTVTTPAGDLPPKNSARDNWSSLVI